MNVSDWKREGNKYKGSGGERTLWGRTDKELEVEDESNGKEYERKILDTRSYMRRDGRYKRGRVGKGDE